MRPIYFTVTANATPVVVPVDVYLAPFQVSVEVEVITAATYGVEVTYDNVQDPTVTPLWSNTDHAGFNPGATTTQRGVQITPVTALRFTKSAGAGSIEVRVVQSGLR